MTTLVQTAAAVHKLPNPRPKLGDKLLIHATAHKDHDWYTWTTNERYHEKQRRALSTFWKTTPLREPFTAYYVGYRVVAEGTIHFEDFGEFINQWLIPDRYRTVWLFVRNERCKPFYAFPEDAAPEAADGTTRS